MRIARAPDSCQPADAKRRRCCAARYQVDSANRDFNAHNKAFGAARKVRMFASRACVLWLILSSRLNLQTEFLYGGVMTSSTIDDFVVMP